jgi:hypothetical protein
MDMNTRIDFTKISNGIPIVHKPMRKISWDSSFMDLYSYADIINIHNIGNKYRLITITFQDQNLFSDWTDIQQDITILINDREFNLKTKGIETVWLGKFPMDKEEYYKITKEYFDNLLKNGQETWENTFGITNDYKIAHDLSVNLSYSNYNCKGMTSEFYFRIKRTV